jgi:hypothetical protein
MLIEITTFELAASADESAFLEADARMQQQFAHLQPGLVRRTTARGDGGETAKWLVLTFWYSAETADRAASAAAADECAQTFRALIDESTIETRRYSTLD